MKILIAGGGTAGHVFPALALGEVLRDTFGADVVFAGTGSGLEAKLVPAAGFRLVELGSAPFVRKASSAALKAPIALLRETLRCRTLVKDADVVVGVGGYASAPPVAAALLSRRPVVLHEQNAVSGAANRLFSRLARVVALSFPEARTGLPRRARIVVTGNPVRAEIARVAADRERLRSEAMQELDLDPGRTTVLIFGGSQGARRIDQAAVGAAASLRGRGDLQFLVLTGAEHFEEVSAALADAIGDGARIRVRSIAFLERMELAYAAADLVVSRAGATSIAEIATAGIAALLIPYPFATGHHQDANAEGLVSAGAARSLADPDVDPATFASLIDELTRDRALLSSMGKEAMRWARPYAAEALASIVVEEGGRA